MRSPVNFLYLGALCLIIVVIGASTRQALRRVDPHSGRADKIQAAQSEESDRVPTSVEKISVLSGDAQADTKAGEAFPVYVRQPDGPPQIELASTDPQGRNASVACSTCHSVREPNEQNRTGAALDEFHQGMEVDHGNLACYACHNSQDADTLRLADGNSLPFKDVMTLCSQCHGPQATAFAHGAHGGMNGHWDLTRGPQFKNNCVDCHDPHAPSYPKMIVGFKPRDRFLEPDGPAEPAHLDAELPHDAH